MSPFKNSTTVTLAVLSALIIGTAALPIQAKPGARPASPALLMPGATIPSTYGVFPEALVAFGDATPEQNRALTTAVAQYQAGGRALAIAPLQTYLAQHPESPWRGALLANIGLMYEQHSYLSKALDYLGQAQAAMGKPTAPAQQALFDAVLGEQLRLQAQLGNRAELSRLLASVGQRRLMGSADAEKAYAQSSLWEIERTPEQVLRCGLVSLLEILKLEQADGKAITKVSIMPAKKYGTSLADLREIARQSGQAMTAIHRAPDEAIPVPSVMHLKLGHFVAIVAREGDRYQVRDPAIGREHWVNREVIDSESSGYFLTPTKLTSASNELRWRIVASKEAAQIIGAGNTTQPMMPPPPCGHSNGMPVASINNPQTSLCLADTPVSYRPPKGPAVSFDLWYFQKNVAQPANRTFSNVGPMWSHNWLAYIQDDPRSPGNNVSIYSRDSGAWTYSGYNAGNGTFAREQTSQALLIQVSRDPVTYERDFPDGSKEIYSQSDGATFAPRRVFLTQVIDKTGNAVTLSYDSQNRLTTITDALGQQTTFSYGDANPLLITGVTDPFGRSVSLAYDNAGRLVSVTDAIGMTTSFTYDATFITSMTTPYGTSQFTSGQQGYHWWATATDPLGHTERIEFLHGAPGIPYSETLVPADTITPTQNSYINYRNTYFWDKAVMARLGGNLDYTQAEIRHWLHRYNDFTFAVPVPILESTKAPLENRVWYYYVDQNRSVMAGPSAQPNQIARVLDDGSTQSYRMTYNAQGNLLTRTDPLGRTTYFDYAANGIDVVQIRQAAGNQQEVPAAFTYNNQHLPLTYTDAAGQTTEYNYNTAGQVTSVTDPDGNTTQYRYNSLGYLESIINANGKTQHSFTYDAIGRLASDTDSEGYTLSYQYDALNRLVRTTYPDGTTEQIAYDKLDVASRTNRLGQTTNYTYDAVRNLRTVTDPMGHGVRYDYDPAGRLISLTDANNQTTSWQRDIEGRVTRTTYPDGTSERYAYDRAGRLIARTDALGQTKTIAYTADNHPQSFTYANAVNPTPSVHFTYDALYPRVTAMQDGTGTTSFQYFTAGSPGAGQLASEQGPRAHDTIQYTYDALSRLVRRAVDGLDETYTYDALNRVTGTTNSLGQFTTSYLGETGQVTGQTIAGVPYQVSYQYETNAADRRLKAILNDTTASGTPQPVMDYALTTSPEDLILSRTENDGSAVARHGRRHHGWEVGRHEGWDHAPHGGVLAWLFGERDDDHHADRRGHRQADPGHRGHHRDHDADDGTPGVATQYTYDPDRRLLAATGGINRDYAYDPADNLTAITTPDATTAIGTDSVNAITTAGSRTYRYDANGNVLDDGKRTYAWDAENRLIRITDTASGHVSTFAYDGRSHRLAVTETDPGAIPVETRYLWCGDTVCETRDSADAVIARYYGQGELQNGGAYYYAQDQVGSVVALIDATGNVSGRVGYDPYGNVTSSTGNLPDYRYAGLYGHDPSGLFLATYRAYDPEVGRWLSRDPIGLAGGLNLYAYVDSVGIPLTPDLNTYSYARNNPLRYIDPTGLAAINVPLPELPFTLPEWITIPAGRILGPIGLALSLSGDTPQQCSQKRDRTGDCNAAFGRCYNRKPNDPVHANRCAAALAQCLNTDLPVLFPHGEVVQ